MIYLFFYLWVYCLYIPVISRRMGLLDISQYYILRQVRSMDIESDWRKNMVYNKLLKWQHVDTDSDDENEKRMPGFPIFLENESMRDILLWRLSTCIIIWSREGGGHVLLSIDTFHNIKIKVYPHLKTSIEEETTNYAIVQWMRWNQVNNQGVIDFRRMKGS